MTTNNFVRFQWVLFSMTHWFLWSSGQGVRHWPTWHASQSFWTRDKWRKLEKFNCIKVACTLRFASWWHTCLSSHFSFSSAASIETPIRISNRATFTITSSILIVRSSTTHRSLFLFSLLIRKNTGQFGLNRFRPSTSGGTGWKRVWCRTFEPNSGTMESQLGNSLASSTIARPA